MSQGMAMPAANLDAVETKPPKRRIPVTPTNKSRHEAGFFIFSGIEPRGARLKKCPVGHFFNASPTEHLNEPGHDYARSEFRCRPRQSRVSGVSLSHLPIKLMSFYAESS